MDPGASTGPLIGAQAPGLPSEHEAGALVDQLPAILYVADAGVDGRWHYVSRGVTAILGFTQEEWKADPGLWARQMHPDDRDRIFEREEALDAPTDPDEYRLYHRDGSTVWVRDDAALVRGEDGNVRWHGVMLDITDRKLAEAELERRAEQQAAVALLGKHALEGEDVAELMHDALEQATSIIGARTGAVLERSGDGGEMIVRASVGVEIPRQPADQLAEGELAAGITAHIEGRDQRWGSLWLAAADGCSVGPADVDFLQTLANILADAIQQRSTEERIRYQALHDPLTGLPNRALFLDRLSKLTGPPRRGGRGGPAGHRQLQARQRQPRPQRRRRAADGDSAAPARHAQARKTRSRVSEATSSWSCSSRSPTSARRRWSRSGWWPRSRTRSTSGRAGSSSRRSASAS